MMVIVIFSFFYFISNIIILYIVVCDIVRLCECALDNSANVITNDII